jgi:TonB dependent receptor/Carboxypeptidase regulatory-like domain/TonB-dependent Receptor Plug Domain
MLRRILVSLALALAAAGMLLATAFGAVRGVVHDPQHKPVVDATVKISSATSDWSATVQSDQDGAFSFPSVPLGDYHVTVTKSGFADEEQAVTVVADSAPALHFQLTLSSVKQTATVTTLASGGVEGIDSVTPTTLVDRTDIAQTPGADRTNSLAMITDYVPAAYVTHDMLHMRGGHQVEWLIDGVPIPNTNIATNLGPQIDPKDIDYLEIQRGSYEADYGDRTYGIFNIVPRTGFERNNEAELVISAGNWYQTNDQINFGGHTERFAYYASLNGNRSNYGLQAPIGEVVHDAENGYGGFASFIYNQDSQNQFRLVTSLRQDFYQIPIDPDPNSSGNQVYPSYGLRDGERETDGYVAFSWIHTFNSKLVLTVSPFYHYSDANYMASPKDTPAVSNVDQTSNYGGLQASVNWSFWKNDLEAGLYGFGQHQNNYFYNSFQPCNLPTCTPLNNPSVSRGITNGGVEETFLSDKFKVTPWLTLIAGVRQTHFTADLVENAVYPRFGVALQVPKLKWILHAFYGKYYQPPPLSTITDSLVDLAAGQSYAFGPLHGERDEEYQFGVTIPFRGWALDADHFQTRAHNWLDHNNIGESNLFWPITWDEALIQTWELTLRSPRLWHRGQFHLAYANQFAQATSPITGGLICPPATPMCPQYPPPGYAPVDHDQRNTLNVGFNSNLPWQSYASVNMYYGSGFTNGMPGAQYPGSYLPPHTSFDISAGKSFGERYSVGLNVLNLGNRRVLLDNSLTFGGFHYNDPRQIYGEFRLRFHY